jgi:hypothetical protein
MTSVYRTHKYYTCTIKSEGEEICDDSYLGVQKSPHCANCPTYVQWKERKLSKGEKLKDGEKR